jgi:hypothetical protein
MGTRLTNGALRELLLNLGFEAGGITEKNNQVFRHPSSDCVLLLPSNKLDEPPRPADIAGIKAELADYGLLAADLFDRYEKSGRLPATT